MLKWCVSSCSSSDVIKMSLSKTLNKTGKPIFFNSCEWGVEDPWEWMVQFANSWRSGPDHHDDWDSTASIIEVNADKGSYAGNVCNGCYYIHALLLFVTCFVVVCCFPPQVGMVLLLLFVVSLPKVLEVGMMQTSS